MISFISGHDEFQCLQELSNRIDLLRERQVHSVTVLSIIRSQFFITGISTTNYKEITEARSTRQVEYIKGFYNQDTKCFQYSAATSRTVSISGTSLAVSAIIKASRAADLFHLDTPPFSTISAPLFRQPSLSPLTKYNLQPRRGLSGCRIQDSGSV